MRRGIEIRRVRDSRKNKYQNDTSGMKSNELCVNLPETVYSGKGASSSSGRHWEALHSGAAPGQERIAGRSALCFNCTHAKSESGRMLFSFIPFYLCLRRKRNCQNFIKPSAIQWTKNPEIWIIQLFADVFSFSTPDRKSQDCTSRL